METLSSPDTDLGVKPEPDPRLLGSSTTIAHYHSYIAHYGSYRRVPQLPKAPAAGCLDAADGVLLATRPGSLRKGANIRCHTDARSCLLHTQQGGASVCPQSGMAEARGRLHPPPLS